MMWLILSGKRTAKALIRSVPLLFAYSKKGFSHDVAHLILRVMNCSTVSFFCCRSYELKTIWPVGSGKKDLHIIPSANYLHCNLLQDLRSAVLKIEDLVYQVITQIVRKNKQVVLFKWCLESLFVPQFF